MPVTGAVFVCLCVRVFCSIACNVTNSKQVHIDFDTGPTYQVSRRRAPGSSQQRLSVVRSLHVSAYHSTGNSARTVIVSLIVSEL